MRSRRGLQAPAHEVGRLRDRRSRHDEAQILAGERVHAGAVIAVVGVSDGVQRPGVNHRQGFARWTECFGRRRRRVGYSAAGTGTAMSWRSSMPSKSEGLQV